MERVGCAVSAGGGTPWRARELVRGWGVLLRVGAVWRETFLWAEAEKACIFRCEGAYFRQLK